MLIRSINGETPEGAVPVEDQAETAPYGIAKPFNTKYCINREQQ
ncbi:hypothetical protein [Staphylococcus aureus]|nr:hypothetical protein [Staphylococcus aureus]